MQREELGTELGRHIYDYSPILKDSVPDSVLQDIASSFFTRNEIEKYSYEVINPGNIPIWTAKAEPKLQLYFEWRYSYSDHGYDAPILELEG